MNDFNDMQLSKMKKIPPFNNITEFSEHMHFARNLTFHKHKI